VRPALAAVALGAALTLAGGTFDAEPLLVAGVSLAVLGAAAWTWVALAARGARVSRQLGATRVVEDEPLAVRVRAAASVPLPGGELAEPLLGAPAPIAAGRRSVRIRVEARFARRGRRVLPPPELVLRDPLGLATRTVAAGGDAAELLVLPRVEPVTVLPEATSAGAGRLAAAPAGVAEVEIDGLRSYRPGSPASRIHWPALARGAGLLERRLRPDGDVRPLVVVDPRGPHPDEALDAAVRAAASLCIELARAVGCGLLLPGERRATRIERDLGAWPAAWARLALVETGAPPPLAGLGGRAGAVFYVAARPLERPPRTLLHGAGPRVLVIPGELAGRAAILEVAGCRGYAVVRGGRRERAA
jgi:uncharacterized protein (DUF58 family)